MLSISNDQPLGSDLPTSWALMDSCQSHWLVGGLPTAAEHRVSAGFATPRCQHSIQQAAPCVRAVKQSLLSADLAKRVRRCVTWSSELSSYTCGSTSFDDEAPNFRNKRTTLRGDSAISEPLPLGAAQQSVQNRYRTDTEPIPIPSQT